MSRRSREAERYFAVALRSQPIEPEVRTDYTRLEAARRAAHGRRGVGAGIAFWVLSLVTIAAGWAL